MVRRCIMFGLTALASAATLSSTTYSESTTPSPLPPTTQPARMYMHASSSTDPVTVQLTTTPLSPAQPTLPHDDDDDSGEGGVRPVDVVAEPASYDDEDDDHDLSDEDAESAPEAEAEFNGMGQSAAVKLVAGMKWPHWPWGPGHPHPYLPKRCLKHIRRYNCIPTSCRKYLRPADWVGWECRGAPLKVRETPAAFEDPIISGAPPRSQTQ